jgi:hypothetical protein
MGTNRTEKLLGIIAVDEHRQRVREIRDDHVELFLFRPKKIPRVRDLKPHPGITESRLKIFRKKSGRNLQNFGIQLDRADYWVGVGARPSQTVGSIMTKARKKIAA